jgi:geranylgeranyl reductase
MVRRNKKYNVAIVGAGPAGLAAARVLAEGKKNVVVIERNKVIGKKVCAGGLTIKDFELGIDKRLIEKSFKDIIAHTPITEDVVGTNETCIATIDRVKLGQYMAKNAEKLGADIMSGAEVIRIDNSNIVLSTGVRIKFDYLIGADGSNSLVRKHLNIASEKKLVAFHYKVNKIFPKLELFVDANLFGSGYVWIFPHKKFTSIGCSGDPKELIDAGTLQKNFEKFVCERKEFEGVELQKSQYESWFINYDYRGHEFSNIFLAGDAAGFASGLTGEGIYFATISGIEIAKKILDPNYAQPRVREIIDIKDRHEKFLAAFNINKALTQAEYDFFGLMLKSRVLDRTLIDNFA